MQFATMNLTDCSDVVPDHNSQKEWEAPAETTIRTTYKPCIGGATQKKDRAERATDRPIPQCPGYIT